jgi:hypothetical protein
VIISACKWLRFRVYLREAAGAQRRGRDRGESFHLKSSHQWPAQSGCYVFRSRRASICISYIFSMYPVRNSVFQSKNRKTEQKKIYQHHIVVKRSPAGISSSTRSTGYNLIRLSTEHTMTRFNGGFHFQRLVTELLSSRCKISHVCCSRKG